MPNLIKLSDQSSGEAEFVNVDEIARIEPSVYESEVEVTETVSKGFGPFKSTKEETFTEIREVIGSKVVLKGGEDLTYVAETPQEVFNLIQGVLNANSSRNSASLSQSLDGLSQSEPSIKIGQPAYP